MTNPTITVARNGRVLGKYDADWIKGALRDGAIQSSDHAIADGMTEWKPLRDWSEFASFAPPAPARVARKPAQAFRGPPHECWNCGGSLKKGNKATNSGSGCIIMILGLCLAPVLIGIPIIFYGLHLSGKVEGFWQCKRCHSMFPRKRGLFG